jgi:hypothetical protein
MQLTQSWFTIVDIFGNKKAIQKLMMNLPHATELVGFSKFL